MFFIFFFSSRRRHTRFDCDWSSDVCSSDLGRGGARAAERPHVRARQRALQGGARRHREDARREPPQGRSVQDQVTVDLYVLVLLAVAALHGTARGALRQLVAFAAAVVGALAARAFAPDVAAGLARTVSPSARGLAPIVLFLGGFGIAS